VCDLIADGNFIENLLQTYTFDDMSILSADMLDFSIAMEQSAATG
jgi:hypothetical protein